MFHLREGFFFERQPDGSVRIVYAPPPHNEPLNVLAEITVPPNEFASVMASVSSRGETSETWTEAVEYLTGKGPWT
jgi:hypothetical protein